MRFCRHCGYSDRDVRFGSMDAETRKVIEISRKEGELCAQEMIDVLRKHQKEVLRRIGAKDTKNVLSAFHWENSSEIKRKIYELMKREFSQAPEEIMCYWDGDNKEFWW